MQVQNFSYPVDSIDTLFDASAANDCFNISVGKKAFVLHWPLVLNNTVKPVLSGH